ncbi:sugar phosphate isomerase/epimerase [Terriglobus roseus DSM 18391]|uniref:Sugar phosphate isomerase/epimerase n=1 Tax=Terriglobus roseus (strain DSM 18391 / NRRL B-41598 / KBS 63) TaxID=926566 RepID=I3ZBF5_TERRK|nr:sugar phosphate isomerase/epimerase family protein [Terriglobus roseus]AFL86573.1 sugar phosphate isomerase/epimerase [Terriglobus roseus DSM 18391]
MSVTRRHFLAGTAALAATAALRAQTAACGFRLAVINDEISSDFEHACYVASHDFGLQWIEVRNLWGTAPGKFTETNLADAKKILAKYNLKVTDLASPFFKSDFPGAPLSKDSPNKDAAKIPADLSGQFDLLTRLIDNAKSLGTDRIRCFDFWRLDDPKPFRKAMNEALNKAADICKKSGMVLVLENEMACNTGSGAEAASLLAAIPNPNLMLNWDPGNSGSFEGDVPYPNDYDRLPKNRIGHVHVKSVSRNAGDKRGFEWQPVGKGAIDWTGQLKALHRDGYRYGLSLETHWHGGPGTTKDEIGESSTRISMQGLKDALKAANLSC